MLDSAQHPSREVVPAGNGNNGRGHRQGGRGGNQQDRGARGNRGGCIGNAQPSGEVAL